MEPFQANLSHYRLALLVPALLERAGAGGRLVVERGPEQRCFDFRDGRVVALRSNLPEEHLGQTLVSLGVIGASRVAEAFEEARLSGITVGRLLVDQQLVSPVVLEAAMAWRIRLAFLECYSWQCGEVRLEAAPKQTEGGQPISGLCLRELHQETVTALPDWEHLRSLLPRMDAPLRAGVSEAPADGPHNGVATAVRHGGSLREALTLAGATPGLAGAQVLGLVLRGVVAAEHPHAPRLDMAAVVAEAAGHLARGAPAEAERLLGEALLSGPAAEAAALYRQAAAAQATKLGARLQRILPRLTFLSAPEEAPRGLTASDLVVLVRLGRSPRPDDEVRGLQMGPGALLQSLKRLAQAGLLAVA